MFSKSTLINELYLQNITNYYNTNIIGLYTNFIKINIYRTKFQNKILRPPKCFRVCISIYSCTVSQSTQFTIRQEKQGKVMKINFITYSIHVKRTNQLVIYKNSFKCYSYHIKFQYQLHHSYRS